MNIERKAAIESAFTSLDGVESATLQQSGEVDGIDLQAHPALSLKVKGRRFYLFLAARVLASAKPEEILTHYEGAVQHYA